MTHIQVNKEDVFQALGTEVAIAATSAGYHLRYSPDGVTWSEWPNGVPAGDFLIIYGAYPDLYFYMFGNVDDDVLVMR